MGTLLIRLAKDESGATAIEYALIGLLISVAIVVSATALGSKLNEAYTAIAGKIPVN